MAVTLEQMRETAPSATDMRAIDELRVNSYLFDSMIFEECALPSGVGTSLSYTYTRVKTPSGANFREYNKEYDASNAEVENHTVHLHQLGGSFLIDRQFVGVGWFDRVGFEISQKLKSATATFNNAVINGDSAQLNKGFDGLDKALTGSSTEILPSAPIDVSTDAGVETNGTALINGMSDAIDAMDGLPSVIILNRQALSKLRAIARSKSAYQAVKTDIGARIETYEGIPLVNLGEIPGTSQPIVKTDTGKTSIYFVRLGEDGFHGLKRADKGLVETMAPDTNERKAVLQGFVEMTAAVALKATKAAAVLRDVKVSAV